MAVPQLRIVGTFFIIATIGTAVWLAVDPLEQIRRHLDRQLETKAREFLAVAESYYKEVYEYPWDTLRQPGPVESAVQRSWLQLFTARGAVDTTFVQYPRWERIFITRRDDMLYACFAPLSKTFKGIAEVQGWQRDGTLGCTERCFECLLSSE